MFDDIAPRYDLLNRLLSFGTDCGWRNRMARRLPEREGLSVLDLATGTADQAIAVIRKNRRVAAVTGLDLSEQMLAIGRGKVERLGLAGRIRLGTGDATAIPEPASSFDAITISFGIRNVTSVPVALADMFRVLKPGGRLLILEGTVPAGKLCRSFYLFYMRHVLPRVAGLVCGKPDAYRYLNRTIESFPAREDFCALMRAAGFVGVSHTALTLGAATLYQGDKPQGTADMPARETAGTPTSAQPGGAGP